jgi:hypothetical protein
VMIGDSPYDVEAAKNAGVETIAVLTGGFSDEELRDAGAVAVYASMDDLRAGLGDTRLGEGRAMRVMFTTYAVLIAAGLALWIVVGLAHH